MSAHDTFSDATGHVYVNGQEVPEVRAVGFVHRHPCAKHSVATVQIGEPFGCDCGGTVLLGWRDWWPLPNDPPSPALVIDLGGCPGCDTPIKECVMQFEPCCERCECGV